MDYLEIDSEYFKNDLVDKFRSPHLWGKDKNGLWKLRHNVFKEGLDD